VREPVWRWAPAPLPLNPGGRDLREQRREEDALKQQMRWIWNEFCSGVDLTHRTVPTGYGTREPPRLGPIDLGPPTRFSVELRPGQLPRDFLDVRIDWRRPTRWRTSTSGTSFRAGSPSN
jgi:hypothetical protein